RLFRCAGVDDEDHTLPVGPEIPLVYLAREISIHRVMHLVRHDLGALGGCHGRAHEMGDRQDLRGGHRRQRVLSGYHGSSLLFVFWYFAAERSLDTRQIVKEKGRALLRLAGPHLTSDIWPITIGHMTAEERIAALLGGQKVVGRKVTDRLAFAEA